MQELAEKGLDKALKLGVEYADVRVIESERRTISVKDGKPDKLSHTLGSGFGVRAIVNGGWGFAGSREMTQEAIHKTVEQAFRIAKASALTTKKKVKLVEVPSITASYETKIVKDPISVPLEEILEILISADRSFRDKSPHVRSTSSQIDARREVKYTLTSEGTRISQKIYLCGGEGRGIVRGNGQTQKRTYEINYGSRGYENIEEVDLSARASQAAIEAESLLYAEVCPTETKSDIILDDSNLALQIHETIGHGSELDRVLGTEVDYAGMSFLTPDKKGNFRYGSKYVNFVADATIEGAAGSFGFDDEGVPAKMVDLVKNGIFVGYQSSRETAAEIGDKTSSGAMKASSPLNLPLVRMTNINLLPGEWKSEEIIEDTKEAILMRGQNLYSVDQMRLNFQFGPEIGWLIKNGEITKVIRNPSYTAMSYDFWGSVDAVAKDDWKMYSVNGCAKGKPVQGIIVGHGGSCTRFRNIRVGVKGGN
ncbi:TldD/PmbA family protein [Candidatus Bathyarchaeota archaeon]|nr:TldD/PmbA family protein [Candidatus Bathyarchaeota archaeon]